MPSFLLTIIPLCIYVFQRMDAMMIDRFRKAKENFNFPLLEILMRVVRKLKYEQIGWNFYEDTTVLG